MTQIQAVGLSTTQTTTHKGGRYLSLVCLVAALSGVLFGFDTAVISGAIGMLKTQFKLSALMEGGTVTSVLVGCLFGVAIAGPMSDRFGRKIVLALSALLFTASAIGATFPSTIRELIVARFVGGTGIGIASMLAPLYIAEISPPHLRGRLIALYQFAITVGILITYFSNAILLYWSQNLPDAFGEGWGRRIFVDEVWRGMFSLGVVPALLFFLLLLFVPESPRWLTKQGRDEEAREILARVAGPEQAAREMDEIRETISHEKGSVLQLFERGMRTRLLIGLALPFFSQIVGINAIIYYGPEILKAAEHSGSDTLGTEVFFWLVNLLSFRDFRIFRGYLGTQVFFGLVNVLFTLVAIWKVDKLGRRPLLLTGIAGTGISIALAGLLFYTGMTRGPWLVALCAIYLACFSFSFGPVCWIIVSEIFPTRIRGRAMSISIFSLWTGCILVSQTFPYLVEHWHPAFTFWLYALTTPAAFLFVWFLVPETKGKTLEQIETQWVH